MIGIEKSVYSCKLNVERFDIPGFLEVFLFKSSLDGIINSLLSPFKGSSSSNALAYA